MEAKAKVYKYLDYLHINTQLYTYQEARQEEQQKKADEKPVVYVTNATLLQGY